MQFFLISLVIHILLLGLLFIKIDVKKFEKIEEENNIITIELAPIGNFTNIKTENKKTNEDTFDETALKSYRNEIEAAEEPKESIIKQKEKIETPLETPRPIEAAPNETIQEIEKPQPEPQIIEQQIIESEPIKPLEPSIKPESEPIKSLENEIIEAKKEIEQQDKISEIVKDELNTEEAAPTATSDLEEIKSNQEPEAINSEIEEKRTQELRKNEEIEKKKIEVEEKKKVAELKPKNIEDKSKINKLDKPKQSETPKPTKSMKKKAQNKTNDNLFDNLLSKLDSKDKKNSKNTKIKNNQQKNSKNTGDVMDDLLKNLSKKSDGKNTKSKNISTKSGNGNSDTVGNNNYNSNLNLSISEKEFIKRKIQSNWRIGQIKNKEGRFKSVIYLKLNEDGSIQDFKIVHIDCPAGINCQAMTQDIERAVIMSSPFEELSIDRYDAWHEFQLEFAPSN